MLHLPVSTRSHKIDYLGTALMGGAITALILVTTWGGTTYPWASSQVISLAVVGVALIVGFIFTELHAQEPLLPLVLFRNSLFAVSSALGFLVGFAMFGAIIYLPTFLQTVFGASATASGLELLPLMAGLVGTSIVGGQLISRRGRYKIFPVLGTAGMVLGLFLLSLLTSRSSLLEASAFMFVLGLGLGGVMQVLVLIVQNAVPYSYLGTATSAATFFRSIGASFGVAIFGAIFNSRLAHNLPNYLPKAGLSSLHGGNVTLTPAMLDRLQGPVKHGFIEAFSHSLHIVFLAAVPVAFVAFILALFIKEVPLRKTSFTDAEAGITGVRTVEGEM